MLFVDKQEVFAQLEDEVLHVVDNALSELRFLVIERQPQYVQTDTVFEQQRSLRVLGLQHLRLNITAAQYGRHRIGLDGSLNQAITIRTFVSRNGELWFQAGGGIVAKSDVEYELQEVNNKLGALRKAIIKAAEL